MSDTDDTTYETLTDPKHFSRLLYTNPVCFLTTIDAKRGRHNSMVISWLTPINNHGVFIMAVNKMRRTAALLLERRSFGLSVAVRGQEAALLAVGRCHGHSSAVLQLDWSADGKVLMSNSLDHEALMWDIRGRPAVDQSQRDTEWDTWTCQLGFPVMGIWSDNMDGTDINAVDRSSRGGHVVVADDNGQVRMLNFPCVIDKAPSHAFPGTGESQGRGREGQAPGPAGEQGQDPTYGAGGTTRWLVTVVSGP